MPAVSHSSSRILSLHENTYLKTEQENCIKPVQFDSFQLEVDAKRSNMVVAEAVLCEAQQYARLATVVIADNDDFEEIIIRHRVVVSSSRTLSL